MIKKIYNYLKTGIGIIFAIIMILFFARGKTKKSEIKKKIREIKVEAEKQKTKVKKIEKRIKERKKMTELRKGEAEILNNKLKKYFKERRDG